MVLVHERPGLEITTGKPGKQGGKGGKIWFVYSRNDVTHVVFTVHDYYVFLSVFSNFQLIVHYIYIYTYALVFLQEIYFVVNIHINFTSI